MRTLLAAGVVSGVLVAGAVGCSREQFEDRTAVVTVDGDVVNFQVDSCGLDEDTLFVVGRSKRGEVLQAVVGLEGDGATGDPAATGFTVDVGPDTYAAFGPRSWSRRSGRGEAPGSITEARLRGSRIQVTARAESVEAEGAPLAAPGPSVADVRVEMDARCDQRDG